MYYQRGFISVWNINGMLNYLLLNPSAECRERENGAFTRMDQFLSARSRVAHPLLLVQNFEKKPCMF